MSRSHASILLTCSFLALTALPSAAAAQQGFGLSLGLIDFTRDFEAFELGVEYRFPEVRWGLVPNVGLHATVDETVYAYAGLRRPFQIGAMNRKSGKTWELVPSLAVSLYEDGDGQDLGSVLEFRSGIDVMRRWTSGAGIGLGFYHLSNASISSTNPGTNSLLLKIELPGG